MGQLVKLAFRREAEGPERFVNLIGIEARLDSARSDIQRAAARVMDRQITEMVRVATKAIEESKASALDRIDVPYRTELAEELTACLQELYDFGAQEVRTELERMGRSAQLESFPGQGFLRERAKAIVGVLAAKLKGALVLEGLRQVREGRANPTRLKGDLDSLSDRELTKIADVSASEALNMGRDHEARRSRVEFAVYSAILDTNVCSPCANNDGRRAAVGSEEYEALNPPYAGCAGRDRCRCIWAYEGPILVPTDIG